MTTTPPIPQAPAHGTPATYIRKPALPALTGIRAIFAILILLFHYTPPHIDPIQPIVNNSYILVGCFFLISGFVLSYNYDDRATTMSKRNFWLARFSRLYPTYLFALFISLPMLAVEWQARSHGEFWLGALLTPILLQGWTPMLATFWNTVAWTLSAEVMLYLGFPYVIRAWARSGPRWNEPVRLIAIILVLWGVGIMPHTWYYLTNPDHLAAPADRYTGAFWIRVLKFSPPAYLCTFLAGLTLGKLHLRLGLSSRQRLLAAAVALTVLGIFFYTVAPHLPYVIIHGALLLPVFCLLILGLSGPNAISTLFGIKPLVLLGEATYALYLLHFNAFLLIHDFYHLPERLHLTAIDPWISYIAIILFAWLTYKFVENPGRKLILRTLGRSGSKQ